jgi:PleD family two-component response regulator
VAEKTRQTVERLVIQHAISNAEPMVTLSLEGASFISDLRRNSRSLIEATHKPLHDAKKSGRNSRVARVSSVHNRH